MNQPLFLHIVERLEGFVGKLPDKIRKPVLDELTPLKQLFLKQRAPRFVLTGSHKSPAQEVVAGIFSSGNPGAMRDVLMEVHRWHTVTIGDLGAIEVLDARGADSAATAQIESALRQQPADMFLHIVDGASGRPVLSRDTEQLATLLAVPGPGDEAARVLGISLVVPGRKRRDAEAEPARTGTPAKLHNALSEHPTIGPRLIKVAELHLPPEQQERGGPLPAAADLLATFAREMPNEARVEMIRISGDRQAQAEIAQTLVKSTTAICAAIGAQPIPFADLPILTTLQLVMVSGIMYVAGRERSLRAATEFAGALGVNVGAGVLLREGTRAVLKFFPGWGNVISGMVAGAGTYALGRAATVYFLQGVSIKDARRIYLASRKKGAQAKLPAPAKGTRRPRRDVPQTERANGSE